MKGWNVICAGVGVAAVVMLGLLWSMRPAATPRAGTTTDQRVLQGPYIASTKALSDTEDLRIVVVPSEFGRPLDVKCFLYRNREWQQTVFTCPDVRQEDISLPELDRPR